MARRRARRCVLLPKLEGSPGLLLCDNAETYDEAWTANMPYVLPASLDLKARKLSASPAAPGGPHPLSARFADAGFCMDESYRAGFMNFNSYFVGLSIVSA